MARKFEKNPDCQYVFSKMFRKYSILRAVGKRWFSPKVMVQMDETLHQQILSEEVNPKSHPGIRKSKTTEIPQWVQNGIKQAIGDYSMKQLRMEADKFVLYLHGRRPPPEEHEIKAKMKEVEQLLLKNVKQEEMSPEDFENFLVNNRTKAKYMLKQRLYPWQAIQYDRSKGLQYLVARGAQDYAVLSHIFNEIHQSDQNFRPKALFDFGSGIGTVTWAATELWLRSIQEYYCVDCSADMNTIAETILQSKPSKLKTVYFRQFLPASHNLTYDLVVSAYSLFELPNMHARLEVLLNLWSKTEKYLIIVEHGTRSGFRIVNEARDFILNICSKEMEHKSAEAVHVVAPCSHELPCPRLTTDDTPCNFEVPYSSLPLAQHSTIARERFSYVIFKKGKRSEDDPQWPRLVRPTLIRTKHVICRMCTSSGNLQEVIVTASKHGKYPYRCSKYSRWGDKLPLTIVDPEGNESNEPECEEDRIE